MPIFNPRNSAEANDGLATLTAAATGLAACIYAINVIEALIPEAAAALLGYIQIAGVILIVAVIAPLLIHLKRRGGRPAGRRSSSGYLGALFRQASLTAFSLTLAFMVVLSIFNRTVLTLISAETVVDLIITVSLALFALSFFVFNRFSDMDEGLGEDV